MDFDYIVESFEYEFKLDVQQLKEIQEEYRQGYDPSEQKRLVKAFLKLYPECKTTKIDMVEVPDTVIKTIYFVQSPKGDDGLPSVHYSLKSKMLNNLRMERIKARKNLAIAAKNNDKLGEIRFNATQLALKIISNSEYGASNNEFFAHFDPDIAACTTCNSRRLIGFLSNALHSDGIYVDRQFLDENKNDIERLVNIECLHITPYTDKDIFSLRRRALASLYDEFYDQQPIEIFKMNFKESVVLYQDTDSNYYTNKYIVDYFLTQENITPELLNECMMSLLAHNNIMANFVKRSVNRTPVGVGFEGAFIVCRYLNRKKKYYGRKWEPGMKITLDDLAYINGVLKRNYTAQWTPKTLLPLPSGDYLHLDIKQLLSEGVNQLDYVNKYGIKCTGVDLARRDQYRFINFSHMRVIQQDLRLIKYEGKGAWKLFDIDEPMKKIIDDIVESFRETIDAYTKIIHLVSSDKPTYQFSILDFAKTGAYRPDKMNPVSAIVRRLREEHKDKFIPDMGERMYYVIIIDEKVKNARAMGRAGSGSITDRAVVVEELLEEVHKEFPEDMFVKNKPDDFDVTYEEFINAQAICRLDFKYYLECLCKSMALYIIGDIFPKDILRIDEGLISSKEANELVTKRQNEIAKMYVQQYFPSGVSVTSNVRRAYKDTAEMKAIAKMSIDDASIIYTIFPSLKDQEITKSMAVDLAAAVSRQLEKFVEKHDLIKGIREFVLTNNFATFISNKQSEMKLYETIKSDPESAVNDLSILSRNIAAYKKALQVLSKIRNKK